MSKELGDLIRTLRIKKGYKSSRSFAQAINKSPTFMWKVEKGEAIPGPETLDKIAELVGHRDEIFRAAKKLQPEVEKNIVEDSTTMNILRRVSQMSPKDKQRVSNIIENLENKEGEEKE